MESAVTQGFAIWCDMDGALQNVIYDSLGIASTLVQSQPIGVIADAEGLSKLLDFLLAVKQYGAAFDWELNVRVQGRIETLHFAGVVSGPAILISGAHSRVNLWQLYDEMMGISNEQTNLVRSLTKSAAPLPPAPVGMLANAARDDELYNETSRLNNELVTLQRELAKKTAELERLNLQKNQFLGMASHDLRSPLNSILAYSEFLVESAAPRLGAEELEYLELIISLSNLMRGVVDDLLDIAAIESGKLHLDLRHTDLAAIFRRAVAVFRPLAAKKQIHLVFEVISPPPRLLLDGHKIEQVLNNLLSNAIKFSHPHTAITLSLTHAGGEALAAVKDQGQGIPPDEVSRLFQPFATTSVKATAGEKSTGLGLLIVRKIVEEHRGRIWVESSPGEGSTFHFALPLVLANPSPVQPPAQPQVPALPPARADGAPAAASTTPVETPTAANGEAQNPLRILLAEDNPANQRLMRKILARIGYAADTVTTVSTGAAALAALHAQTYDVLLLDIHMPEMDGLEATRRIRAELPTARQPTIVALAANSSAEMRAQCVAAGMDGWIEKPTPSSSENLRRLLAACPRLRL
ncbi:MAG: hybrid sensor histidine kinase/response regulator [Caldilineaceae bacterium]